jgi:hypothetical protein
MSYYQARKAQLAKQYLAEREAEDKIKPPSERIEASRAWLDGYMARPRRTSIDWAPRWPSPPANEKSNARSSSDSQRDQIDIGSQAEASQRLPAAPEEAGRVERDVAQDHGEL